MQEKRNEKQLHTFSRVILEGTIKRTTSSSNLTCTVFPNTSFVFLFFTGGKPFPFTLFIILL